MISVPPILYKYTSSSTAKIILATGAMRWSSPIHFNDASEFQRMPRFEPSLAEAHLLLHKVISDTAAGKSSLDESRLSSGARILLMLGRIKFAEGVEKNSESHSKYERPDADEIMDKALYWSTME